MSIYEDETTGFIFRYTEDLHGTVGISCSGAGSYHVPFFVLRDFMRHIGENEELFTKHQIEQAYLEGFDSAKAVLIEAINQINTPNSKPKGGTP